MPAYIMTGRGGAGNARSSQPTTAPRSTAHSTAPRYVSSGIGGAGNIHVSSSAAVHAAQQDDLRVAAEAAARPALTAYVGRGGAGNVYRARQSSSASESSSVCSDASTSTLSSKAKAWANAAFKKA